MQRRSGPYAGYFIAAEAVAVGQRFVGHAKVSVAPLNGDPHAGVVAQVQTIGAYVTPDEAIWAAEFQARMLIDGLPPDWDPLDKPPDDPLG
jgi:hypothetical protein